MPYITRFTYEIRVNEDIIKSNYVNSEAYQQDNYILRYFTITGGGILDLDLNYFSGGL